jgi:hypothetical protein
VCGSDSFPAADAVMGLVRVRQRVDARQRNDSGLLPPGQMQEAGQGLEVMRVGQGRLAAKTSLD